MWCYVGKATKIFIFIVTLLVVVGLILGFGLLFRHKPSSQSHSHYPSPPLIFPNNPTYSLPQPQAPPSLPPPDSSSSTSSNLPPPPPPPPLQSLPPPESSGSSPPDTLITQPPPPPDIIIGPAPTLSPPGQPQLTPAPLHS